MDPRAVPRVWRHWREMIERKEREGGDSRSPPLELTGHLCQVRLYFCPSYPAKCRDRRRLAINSKGGKRHDQGYGVPQNIGGATTKGGAIERRRRTTTTCKGVMIPQNWDSTPSGSKRMRAVRTARTI